MLRKADVENYVISSRTRKIWEVELGLAEKFIEICNKHDLKYFAWAGTLLGAVRHRGFVPWDSDMDFAMPREDFDKFAELVKDGISDPYLIQCNETDPEIFMGAKIRIRDSRTTGVEVKDLSRRSNWGIWIDVLCLDYIYEDEKKRAEQTGSVRWYIDLVNHYINSGNNKYSDNDIRDAIVSGYDNACRMCYSDIGKTGLICRFHNGFNPDVFKPFFTTDIEETVDLKFENITIKAPKGYERVLAMYYGDYNNLKPAYNADIWDGSIMDPETPFADYQHRLMDLFEDADDKTIALFGAGNMVNSYLAEYGDKYRPSFIVDNGKAKWGTTFNGMMIYAPDKLLTIPKDELRVIVCNIYYREISKQLEEMGIEDYYLYAENLSVLDQTLFPERLEEKQVDNRVEEIELVDFHGAGVGKRIDNSTGLLTESDNTVMSTFKLYHVESGDIAEVTNSDYEFCVGTYSGDIDGQLIYTYCYQIEENWTSYNHDLNEISGYLDHYDARDGRYLRFQVRRRDKGEIPVEAESENLIRIRRKVDPDIKGSKVLQCKDFFADEIRDTATKILSVKEEDKDESIAVALLADTHYVAGGTWDDTVNNLRAVNEQVHFDAIVHLGDITDGLGTKALTEDYTNKVFEDMESLEIPVYPVIGNHDTNYFKGNPEVMTAEEQVKLYYKVLENASNTPWYFKDDEEKGLRMIFLSSFDPKQKVRYGFDEEEVTWLKDTLDSTPKSLKVIIFAHIPLLPEMHYWSKEIRNSDKILDILKSDNAENGRIIGYVHGHSHCDQINTEHGFPIVSVGCNKLEYFKDYKPEGATTYKRKLGEASQDLWDGLIITPSKNKLSFVRFGAGEDRSVSI